MVNVLVSLCFGWALLRVVHPREDSRFSEGVSVGPVGNVAQSFLLGWLVMTQTTSALLICGVELQTCAWVLPLFGCAAVGASVLVRPFSLSMSRPSLKWYEIALGLFVLWQIGTGLWYLMETPLVFDDALTAWAGRGRALYGGVNWSFVPKSLHFMGRPGPADYPLGKVVSYALGGVWNRGFDDVLVRFDTLIFYLCTAGILWDAVGQFKGTRFFRSAAAFAVLALPFNFLHALSGYGDILVQSFGAAALGAVLGRRSLIAGLFVAGTALSKNDALVLMVPGLVVCFLFMLFPRSAREPSSQSPVSELLLFAAGLSLCVPWLAFRQFTVLGGVPGTISMAAGWGIVIVLFALPFLDARLPRTRTMNLVRILPPVLGGAGLAIGLAVLAFHRLKVVGLAFHADAPLRLVLVFFNSPTHGVIWLFCVMAVVLGMNRLLRDAGGRGVAALMVCSGASLVFLFSCTGAYEWLVSETSVNRIMLQFYATSILGAFYSLSLQADQPEDQPA